METLHFRFENGRRQLAEYLEHRMAKARPKGPLAEVRAFALAVLGKVEAIIREEMAAIGSQEVHFPALLPKEPYEATNRWTEYGDGIFRL